MFVMTANIILGTYKPVKPHAISWKRSIDNYSDTASIKLPAVAMMKKATGNYEQVETLLQLKEGMKVEIEAGYNGLNQVRFKGFIRRRNFSTPVELECEGYSYQLRKKIGINKSYPTGTKLKVLLQDMVDGTDITLSNSIPDVTIQCPVPFKNVSGIQILEWLKEKMLMTVYFNFDVLYVGLRETELKGTVKFRLGWNVVKDDALKFNADREYSEVRIQLSNRKADGTITKAYHGPKDGSIKEIKMGVHVDDATLAKIAIDKKNEYVNTGYEGTITAFLIPYVEPGMAASIDDKRYPERKGSYFVDSVDGDFGPSGGRQKIKIGNVLTSG